MIKQLVDAAALVADVEAKTKDAVLKELLQTAWQRDMFPKKSLAALQKRLSERESLGSTGLGNSVAVPHVKHESIEATCLVLGRVRSGVEWQAIDGRPVQIVFLVMSPMADPESHLQCLRWISTLARNPDFRRFLLDARDEQQMRELLLELLPKS